MRVISVGASGAAGAAVLRKLSADKQVDEVVSLVAAGTVPPVPLPADAGIEWREVDLTDDLSDHLRFADAVVFSGWLLMGGEKVLAAPESVFVTLQSVCRSLTSAGVHTFVYCSPVGAKAPDVDVSRIAGRRATLPTFSTRLAGQSSRCERFIDSFQENSAVVRVVRLRPGLLVGGQPEGGVSWLGKKIGNALLGGKRIRIVPDLQSCGLQILHISDMAQAICLALTESVLGVFDVAAGSIEAELLAEVFAARRAPMRPRLATAILSLGRHFGFSSMDPAWFEMALRSPLLDQSRARDELGWVCEHSAAAVLEEWAENMPFRRDSIRHESSPVIHVPTVDPVDHRVLYRDSLEYFGRLVSGISDNGWNEQTGYQGWNIWQVVASVALQQYRVVLTLKGHREEKEIETLLPGDPLGIAPADGWKIAAEQGNLAVDSGATDGEGITETFPGLDQLLIGTICEIVLMGWYLGRAIGTVDDIEPELSRFVHNHLEVFA